MELKSFLPSIATKNTKAPVEIKSHLSNMIWPVSFPEFLSSNGNDDLSAFASIQLYMSVMPFNNAVSKRARAFANIPPRLWDKESKVFLDGGDALDILEKPNADVSRIEFMEAMASFYDITGDAFIVATGRVDMPPLELANIPPQSVGFGRNSNRFGMLHIPNSIEVTTNGGGSVKFIAEEDQDLGLRFINQARDKELWHIRTFNPLRSGGNFRGMSKARPIWLELQQYASGNTNNLSMLKRGTRISMAWVNNRDVELTDTQWSRMQEEAQKYAGDRNAGGTPILDGMDVKSIQANNRDMQFKDLQEAMVARISTQYDIPLAMLLEKTMTFNNLQTSQLQFFDGGVLPLTTTMYGELSRFLLPRYKGMENVIYQYNENDIEAVRLRQIETAKAQGEIGVNSTNELRTVIGYEELDDAAADDVLIGLDKIPLGTDRFTTDNLRTPGLPGTPTKFAELMAIVKNKDGEPKYSHTEIKQMTQNYYPGGS